MMYFGTADLPIPRSSIAIPVEMLFRINIFERNIALCIRVLNTKPSKFPYELIRNSAGW